MTRRRGGGPLDPSATGGAGARGAGSWIPVRAHAGARQASMLPTTHRIKVAESAPLPCAAAVEAMLRGRRADLHFLPQAAAGRRQAPLHLCFPCLRAFRARSNLERAAVRGGFGPRRDLPCFSRSIGGPLVEQQRPPAVKLRRYVDGEHGATLVEDSEAGMVALVLRR